MRNRIDNVEKRADEFTKLALNSLPNDSMINKSSELKLDDLNELKNSVSYLEEKVNKMCIELDSLNELKAKIESLENSLIAKLDREEFEKWKAECDFQQIINGLKKKFADRNEILKALRKLEDRINSLEELLRANDTEEVTGNALLATRPLKGWSCASCKKDLINLEGNPAQFNPWAKFPNRSPAERMARIGQGYSHMISMIKTEQLNRTQYPPHTNNSLNELEPVTERPSTRTHNRGLSVEAESVNPVKINLSHLPGLPPNK